MSNLPEDGQGFPAWLFTLKESQEAFTPPWALSDVPYPIMEATEPVSRPLPEGVVQMIPHTTQQIWNERYAREDAQRKAEDEAREAALTPQERQFRGFGRLVWQELSKTIDTLNESSEDFEGCIVCNWPEDDLLKFFSPVISRCAYAFAKHVIDHVDYVELEMSFDREELVMTMPDLDAWPEETSNSKEQ